MTTKKTTNNPVRILLIEDSEVDTFLVTTAIKELKAPCILQTHTRADDALEELIQASEDELPDLLLLDLNTGIMDGFELIDELEISNRFDGEIPFKIYILTNSILMRDREKFERQEYATKFIEKPISSEALKTYIEADFGI